jgi:hypothetical protein
MTAGSGDWDSLSDEQRARYIRSERKWSAKSATNKVLTYVWWTLLVIVVGIAATYGLDVLNLQP